MWCHVTLCLQESLYIQITKFIFHAVIECCATPAWTLPANRPWRGLRSQQVGAKNAAVCSVENRSTPDQSPHRVIREPIIAGMRKRTVRNLTCVFSHSLAGAFSLAAAQIRGAAAAYPDSFLDVYRLLRRPSWTGPDLRGPLRLSKNQTFYPIKIGS